MRQTIAGPAVEAEEEHREQQPKIKSFQRTLVLDWSGNSLVDLARSPEKAVWSVPTEDIFYDGMDNSVSNVVKKQDLLNNAILKLASQRYNQRFHAKLLSILRTSRQTTKTMP